MEPGEEEAGGEQLRIQVRVGVGADSGKFTDKDVGGEGRMPQNSAGCSEDPWVCLRLGAGEQP